MKTMTISQPHCHIYHIRPFLVQVFGCAKLILCCKQLTGLQVLGCHAWPGLDSVKSILLCFGVSMM